MIKLDGRVVNLGHFPDGTLLLKEQLSELGKGEELVIKWNYENNEELLSLYFLTVISEHIES